MFFCSDSAAGYVCKSPWTNFAAKSNWNICVCIMSPLMRLNAEVYSSQNHHTSYQEVLPPSFPKWSWHLSEGCFGNNSPEESCGTDPQSMLPSGMFTSFIVYLRHVSLNVMQFSFLKVLLWCLQEWEGWSWRTRICLQEMVEYSFCPQSTHWESTYIFFFFLFRGIKRLQFSAAPSLCRGNTLKILVVHSESSLISNIKSPKDRPGIPSLSRDCQVCLFIFWIHSLSLKKG